MAQQTGQAAKGQPAEALDEGVEDVFEVLETDAHGNPLQQPPRTDTQETEDDDDDLDGAGSEAEDDDDDDIEPAQGAQDDRLGHTEGDQDQDPRARRRNENRLKRQRKTRERHLQEGRINELTNAVVELQSRLQRAEGGQVQANVQNLRTRLSDIDATLEESRATWRACSEAGDWAGAQEVIDAQFTLREQRRMVDAQIRRAEAAIQQDNGGRRQAAPQQNGQRPAPQADPRVIEHAQDFADDHDWFDPTGGDKLSRRVQRVDNALLREGYDPRSARYWTELRTRVAEFAPQSRRRAQQDSNPNNGGGSREAPAQQRRIGGPRMAAPSQAGGSTKTLGKNQVLISPERKAAMQQAGAWDPGPKRTRLLRYYAEQDRKAAENR